jgi:hypothetical protein
MIAFEGESLNPAVSAIGYDQKRSLATWIDPLSMRIVEFAVVVSGPGDLT